MGDLQTKLREASAQADPRWTDDRAREVHRGLHVRKRRRERTRRATSAAALALVLVLVTLAGTGRLAIAAAAVQRWFSAIVSTTEAPPASAPPPSTSTPNVSVRSPGTGPSTDTPAGPEGTLVTSTPPDTSTAPSASSPKPAPKLTADWRSLARNQDFARAYDALRSGPPDVRDEPQDLLLASDVARLSKHPEEALAPLRKILRDHRKDSRAPVAAFTLGRVLLQDLKRPGEAADAFADARALDPNGTLAEDALAREVESAALTGDAARARTRAEEYVTRYPNGARVGSVKRHGGIP